MMQLVYIAGRIGQEPDDVERAYQKFCQAELLLANHGFTPANPMALTRNLWQEFETDMEAVYRQLSLALADGVASSGGMMVIIPSPDLSQSKGLAEEVRIFCNLDRPVAIMYPEWEKGKLMFTVIFPEMFQSPEDFLKEILYRNSELLRRRKSK